MARQSGRGPRAGCERYCVDPAFLAGARPAIAADAGIDGPTIPEVWVSYILTTGAGWRSPIGDFRLVVDKGEPDNLVSFCGEDVRRISPTQFEMRRRNWRPDRNLDVLFLRPYGRGGSMKRGAPALLPGRCRPPALRCRRQ